MILKNSDGDYVQLDIEGYQYPDLEREDYDSNWLLFRGKVSLGGRTWTFTDPCLLNYEASELANWFDAISKGTQETEEMRFIEPNLCFKLTGRENLRVFFELEARPSWVPRDWASMEDLFIEIDVDPDAIGQAAADLRTQLQQYPQRANV